jgi:hypothetical protein
MSCGQAHTVALAGLRRVLDQLEQSGCPGCDRCPRGHVPPVAMRLSAGQRGSAQPLDCAPPRWLTMQLPVPPYLRRGRSAVVSTQLASMVARQIATA